ncbi:MAG TPA: hypothetical protein DEB35_00870 [Desulfuromonas sp.]|nr:hypothetical protein [Desulfuromonas sp.]
MNCRRRPKTLVAAVISCYRRNVCATNSAGLRYLPPDAGRQTQAVSSLAVAVEVDLPIRVAVSLKVKMTLVVSLVVGLVLAVTGSVVLHSLAEGIRAHIAEHQFSVASENAARIDAELLSLQKLLNAAAERFPLDSLNDSGRLRRNFDERFGALAQATFDNGIFLLDADGRLLAQVPYLPERQGRDFSFRAYFQETMAAGRPIISEPNRSSENHQHPVVNLTVPLRDRSGRLIAVLAGSLDLTRDNLLGRLGRVRFGENGYLYLFNADRLMITHPESARIMQRDVAAGSNPLFARAIEGFEGTGETVDSRGVVMLDSFKRLQSVDWIIGATQPLDEAYVLLWQMRRGLLAGLAAMLLLSVLATWFYMHHLISPLLTLIEHVQRHLAAPGTVPQLPVTTRDEIGLLGATFNGLMVEIEKRKQLEQGQLQLLQTLIDTLPQPIYYMDLDGRFLGCNRAFEEVPGCSREDLVGRTLPELVRRADAAATHQADLALMRRKEGNTFEIFEHAEVYSDDSVHEVLHCKAVFFDGIGAAAGMVGTMIDISQRKAFENALAEAQAFSENLLQNCAVPCFVIDANHTVLTWTRACEELTGVPGNAVVGTNEHWRAFYAAPRPCLADMIVDDNFDLPEYYGIYAASPLLPEGFQAAGWFDFVGGRRRYLLFEAAPIRDGEGKIIAAIETLNDLTGLKQIEQALRESEASYRTLIEHSPDAILVHRAGHVIFGNEAAARLFAAPAMVDLAGFAIMDLVHPDWREIVAERVRCAEEMGQEQPYIEEKVVALDGTVIDVEAGSIPVFYRGAAAVQTILRDITERKQLHERVWRQANYDALTGAPNRLLFFDRVQQTLARAEREGHHVALLFIDLDHFKEINDTLGHEAGDELLRQVAQRLTDCLRKTDTLARMGGDEFTVLMPQFKDPAVMSIVAQRLLGRLSSPFQLPGGDGRISGSIGIAFFPEDGKDAASLLRAADAAMYQAKERGRNTYVFYAPQGGIPEA